LLLSTEVFFIDSLDDCDDFIFFERLLLLTW
jgi:hypothetical protein